MLFALSRRPQASQVALSDLANHAALSDSATDYPLYPCRHPDFSFLRTDEVRLCLTHDTKSTDDRRGPHAGLRHRRVHSAPHGPSKRSCKYALSLCTRWYVHRRVTAPCLTNLLTLRGSARNVSNVRCRQNWFVATRSLLCRASALRPGVWSVFGLPCRLHSTRVPLFHRPLNHLRSPCPS